MRRSSSTRSRPRTIHNGTHAIAEERARRTVDALLVVLVLVVLAGVALGRIVPMTGLTTLIVGGPSMTPAIPVGAALIAEPVAPADLAVGDVVSLRTGSAQAVFTHRIARLVEREGGIWLETKGDANVEPDPALVPVSAVIGRVVVTIPYAGYLVTVLSQPIGMVFVLSLAGLFLVAGWLLEPASAGWVRTRARARPPSIRADPSGVRR
jgi:signal peptidase I